MNENVYIKLPGMNSIILYHHKTMCLTPDNTLAIFLVFCYLSNSSLELEFSVLIHEKIYREGIISYFYPNFIWRM